MLPFIKTKSEAAKPTVELQKMGNDLQTHLLQCSQVFGVSSEAELLETRQVLQCQGSKLKDTKDRFVGRM
jgi:hypothetical protein